MKERTNFKNEIKNKLREPWKQDAFIGYFILTIILSAIAIFTPLYNISQDYVQNISSAIGTFFLASIVSSTIDLNLSFKTINKASFSIYTIIALIIVIALFAFTILYSGILGLISAIIGFLFSLFIWVIANSEKEILNDEKHTIKLKESFAKTNDFGDLLKQITDSDE